LLIEGASSSVWPDVFAPPEPLAGGAGGEIVRVSMSRNRPVALGLAFSMALACAAPLASAGEPAAIAPSSASLSARAAAKVAKLKPTSRALMQTGSTTSTTSSTSGSSDNRSFFRTPTGIAAAVLMLAGAGFVAYSIGHDNEKVHSPIR
jgi:hypothetical protein